MLLDRTTAGVLQIDLGVAFEQGAFLNTPETVGGGRRALPWAL
jgi:phosphatidylinositol kinase/protein kinase (PI-3  family)